MLDNWQELLSVDRYAPVYVCVCYIVLVSTKLMSLHTYTCNNLYAYMLAYMYLHTHVGTYLCICLHMNILTYTNRYIYTYIRMCMLTYRGCMGIRVCIRTYVYT